MTTWFDQCFDKLISHEGGYVNDPSSVIEYVDEQKIKSHTRTGTRNFCGIDSGNARTHAVGGFNLCAAVKRSWSRMFGSWVRPTSLFKRALQCSLHPPAKGPANGCTGASQKTRGLLRSMWNTNWHQRRMGALPAPLPAITLRDAEGCGGYGFGSKVRTLRRVLSSVCFRLPSPRGQDRLTERNVQQQLIKHSGQGVSQVYFAVCQLPQTGAPR